jgi:hypothetical protein
MWRPCSCGLQPVDAGVSALPRSGTPENHFLAASNRPGVAGARIAEDRSVDAERDRYEKADASANRRGLCGVRPEYSSKGQAVAQVDAA